MGSDEESNANAAAKCEAALAAAIQGSGVAKKEPPVPTAAVAAVADDDTAAAKPQSTSPPAKSDDGSDDNDSVGKGMAMTTFGYEDEDDADFGNGMAMTTFGYEDDDDDEPEWAGGDDDDSDDGSADFAPESMEDAIVDPVILNGTIHLNEEGRVIYSGTWCLQSELNKEGKKHPKFKLKSQDSCHGCDNDGNNNGDGKGRAKVLFDIYRPTLSKLPEGGDNDNNKEVPIPTRRTMIFDGFFFEPLPATTAAEATANSSSTNGNGHHKHHHHHHGKKIKERDVELFFTTSTENNFDTKDSHGTSLVAYRISGRGYNEYGPFVLNGAYMTPPPKPPKGLSLVCNEDEDGGGKQKERKVCASVRCEKTYGSGGDAKATRSGSGGGAAAKGGAAKRSRRYQEDDDSFDDDFDEKADYGEVNDLCEDATLSIEELRRKYYGGGGGDEEEDENEDGGGKAMTTKRARLDDSDDDECGF